MSKGDAGFTREISNARGLWRGLAGHRVNAPSHTSATRRHCVEGAGGSGGPGCDTRGRWRGLAAVPVGGGRARAGLEIDHSEPQARVWRSRGRAAAHRHTQRPGPTAGASGTRNTSSTMLWRWWESNPRPNAAPGTPGEQQATKQRKNP